MTYEVDKPTRRELAREQNWYDDIEEIIAYAKWFLDGSNETWRCAVDIFESPELHTENYNLWKGESNGNL